MFDLLKKKKKRKKNNWSMKKTWAEKNVISGAYSVSNLDVLNTMFESNTLYQVMHIVQ